MSRRVFRGAPWRAGLIGIARLATLYFGALAVLLVLGLGVHGALGWALVVAPLAAIVALRVWTWQRFSAEVGDGLLRYEGARPADDFVIELDALREVRIDESRRGHPLRLTLDGGVERELALGRTAARALHAHLLGGRRGLE